MVIGSEFLVNKLFLIVSSKACSINYLSFQITFYGYKSNIFTDLRNDFFFEKNACYHFFMYINAKEVA